MSWPRVLKALRGTRRPEAAPAPDPGLAQVAVVWSEMAETRQDAVPRGWLDSTLVLEGYVQPRLTGDPRTNWLVGIGRRLGLAPPSRWLSLGCGSAGQEVFASRMGLVGSMVALDAAPGALELARQACAREGVSNIEFGPVDLNAPRLPRGPFDVVLMNMSLHHVRELEQLLDAVREVLVRGGLLLANEFVGARQFQFPEAQLARVRELLALLPDRLRRDVVTGGLKTEYVTHPVEWWNRTDPSEAVRSDEIVAQVGRRFRIEERLDYGGTFLALVLEHVVHNFRADVPEDRAILLLLARLEEAILASGAFASDFTVLVARRL